MSVHFPNNSQRLVEIGRTGTGKTVAGLYVLSRFDLSSPWVLFNFKDDEHIESIEKARRISYDYVPKPKDEGLFVIDVLPADLRGSLAKPSIFSQYLEKLWARQNVGTFYDEASRVGDDDNYEMILTQGRSRRLPVIACTQRPSWLSRYTFSEASYIQCFDLNDDRDIQTVESFMPLSWDDEPQLEDHQSFYFDVARNQLVRLNPCPDMDEIRNRFDMKLKRQRVMI